MLCAPPPFPPLFRRRFSLLRREDAAAAYGALLLRARAPLRRRAERARCARRRFTLRQKMRRRRRLRAYYMMSINIYARAPRQEQRLAQQVGTTIARATLCAQVARSQRAYAKIGARYTACFMFKESARNMRATLTQRSAALRARVFDFEPADMARAALTGDSDIVGCYGAMKLLLRATKPLPCHAAREPLWRRAAGVCAHAKGDGERAIMRAYESDEMPPHTRASVDADMLPLIYQYFAIPAAAMLRFIVLRASAPMPYWRERR